jgi:hypothetical protein
MVFSHPENLAALRMGLHGDDAPGRNAIQVNCFIYTFVMKVIRH